MKERYKPMTVRELTKTIERQYKNNGQHLEQLYRYNVSGKMMKADNLKGNDLGSVQIKSARASVCKGLDFESFILNDTALVYAYVVADGSKAYEMNKTEWIEFVSMFGTVITESNKNGGAVKIRLSTETKRIVAYLER